MLLTAPGAAAIAVVRVIGPGVEGFLRERFSRTVRAGRCVHGELRDGRTVLDDPVVVRGEGFADLSLHGGPWVVRSVLGLLRREGFDVSQSAVGDADVADGETLFDREVSAHLGRARTELGVRYLAAQPALWAAVRGRGFAREELEAALGNRALGHLLDPPRVAIVGVPNVGKSTLANQLFGRERSIVADVPGTTRDWVGEYANIEGLAVMLVDTPGLRDTADAIEAEAIERSRAVVRGAELVVVVLDPTQGERGQRELLGEHPSGVVVANKTDLVGAWVPPADALGVCAASGAGIGGLRGAIRGRFGVGGEIRAACWTSRQREAVRSVLDGWGTSIEAFFEARD